MQPQPDVLGGGRRGLEVGDDHAAYLPGHVAHPRRGRPGPTADRGPRCRRCRRRRLGPRARRARVGEPDVEHGAGRRSTVARPRPQAAWVVSHGESLRIGHQVRCPSREARRGPSASRPRSSVTGVSITGSPRGLRPARPARSGLTGRCGRRCTRAAGRRGRVAGVLLDHVHEDVAHARPVLVVERPRRRPRSSMRVDARLGGGDLAPPRGARLLDDRRVGHGAVEVEVAVLLGPVEPRRGRLALEHAAGTRCAPPWPGAAPARAATSSTAAPTARASCSASRPSHFISRVSR